MGLIFPTLLLAKAALNTGSRSTGEIKHVAQITWHFPSLLAIPSSLLQERGKGQGFSKAGTWMGFQPCTPKLPLKIGVVKQL